MCDGSRYRVGRDSAGAHRGRAAYRRGGPLTVTDANIMLGRIQPAHFPRVFGERGDQPLDAGIVREQFAALALRIGAAAGGPPPPLSPGSGEPSARSRRSPSPEQVAAGFLEIAVANMANAIKKISVQRGYDVTRYVLATFGGAGGADGLAVGPAPGPTPGLIHPPARGLSALGMGLSHGTAVRQTAAGGTPA